MTNVLLSLNRSSKVLSSLGDELYLQINCDKYKCVRVRTTTTGLPAAPSLVSVFDAYSV